MSSTAKIYVSDIARLDDNVNSSLIAPKHTLAINPGTNSRLVFLTDPTSLAVEQYKILRRRLCTSHPQGGTVLITSPSPGEGKTLTSINLAWCLAEGGHETCLVDLDFRAPGISRTLECAFEEYGVEDVIQGKATIHQSIRSLQDIPLHILGVRSRRATPGGLLSSESIRPFLKNLSTMFRWIILDFAPIIPMADVGEMLPHVDGALMVIRTGKTVKSMISPSLEVLRTKIWGVIVNNIDIEGSSYYGNYGSHFD